MARPWHEQADLIVVGGSVAGLTTAITAADRGARAIVLERTKELGGGAANEAELIAAAGSRFQQAAGIADEPARLTADLVTATRDEAERPTIEAIAAQGAPLIAWLADRCGVPVMFLPSRSGHGHSVARLHAPGDRGGASLTGELTRAATRHAKIAVRTNALVERVIRDESGAVQGIAVRGDRRGAQQSLSGRVVLACGGFAGDDALVTAHCPGVADLPYLGGPRATGEALRLGQEAGAATRRLASCLVTPYLATPGQLAVTAPLIELGAVLVDQAGKRFADETTEPLPLATAVRAQAGRVAYLLFDERIAAAARDADPFFAHVVLPRMGRRGATVEDLAKQLELHAATLTQTVDAVASGTGPFGRARPGGPFEPPFHAIRVTGARWRTLGGLAIDAAARVLTTNGDPIPNLYAVGGAAAGLGGEGTTGLLPGIDTLTALALARLAALDIATTIAASEPE